MTQHHFRFELGVPVPVPDDPYAEREQRYRCVACKRDLWPHQVRWDGNWAKCKTCFFTRHEDLVKLYWPEVSHA